MAKITKTAIQREIRSFFETIEQVPTHPKAYDAVVRALYIVQAGQEPMEVASEDVKYNNHRGWCPCDVKFASSLYWQHKNGRRLTEKQIKCAASMLKSYSRQLAEHRMAREARQARVQQQETGLALVN